MRRLAAFVSLLSATSGCALIAGLDATYGVGGDAAATEDDGGTKTFGDGAAYDGPPVDGGAIGDGRCASARGPAMTELAFAAFSYCVDSTEVTVLEYSQFLSAAVDIATQPSVCAWNANFAPNCDGADAKRPNQPINCIDWCDAFAYCAWAGKRLCGKIGGGANRPGASNDPAESQWFAACSDGAKRQYPYGNIPIDGACAAELADPTDVASHPQCEGGFQGLFDMTGNVDEWEDSCDADGGADDGCQLRGGDIHDPPENQTCNQGFSQPRKLRVTSTGFRCCKD